MKERKKALAVERDVQQKDKYRALAEERERASKPLILNPQPESLIPNP